MMLMSVLNTYINSNLIALVARLLINQRPTSTTTRARGSAVRRPDPRRPRAPAAALLLALLARVGLGQTVNQRCWRCEKHRTRARGHGEAYLCCRPACPTDHQCRLPPQLAQTIASERFRSPSPRRSLGLPIPNCRVVVTTTGADICRARALGQRIRAV